MSAPVQGPGILYVRSRIASSAKDVLDEKTFLKWYDEEHITEAVDTSGIKSGFRYVDVNGSSGHSNPKPFLAFYPLENTAFTMSDEFKNISVQSENLPGSGVVYDSVDFDVSCMGFESKSESKDSGNGGAEYILTCGLRPQTPMDSFLAEQISDLSQSPNYIRTLVFTLQFARTNAESRKLKGLPSTDEPSLEPSSWLAMHEFERKPEDTVVTRVKQELKRLGDVEGEVCVWGLAKVHGKGEML